MRFRVLEVKRFIDFQSMLASIGVEKMLPGADVTVQEGAEVFRGFGDKYINGEARSGAVALRLAVITD